MDEPSRAATDATDATDATAASDASDASDAIAIARALDDAKCEDITLLDVRGLSSVTDFIVIASGTSSRQIHTAITKSAEQAEQLGAQVFSATKDANANWALLDLIDVVAHVFEPATREHYALEMLWGDAPRVGWQQSGCEER